MKFLVIVVFIVGVVNAKMVSSLQTVPPQGYKLVWNDEFSGDKIDFNKWSHRALGQRKLGFTTEDAVSVSQGSLKIKIYKEKERYCSGMIGTEGKFESKYGYYEIRAKLPSIKGPQAAFWLTTPTYGQYVGNPEYSGMEIDIMEHVQSEPGKIHFTTHWDGYGKLHKQNHFAALLPNIEDGSWHTFGLLWTKDKYVFYVDGFARHTKYTPISQREQYIILSAEIGPWGGDISQAKLPDVFEVDYVRVYQKDEK